MRNLNEMKKGVHDFEHQCEVLNRHVLYTKFEHSRDVIACIEYLKVNTLVSLGFFLRIVITYAYMLCLVHSLCCHFQSLSSC